MIEFMYTISSKIFGYLTHLLVQFMKNIVI